MQVIYTDLDSGWQMVREGTTLREVRDNGDETFILSNLAPLETVEYHGSEVDKRTGGQYLVLSINGAYPNDVVECESFRIIA
ncbi:hypothetical protein GCM10028801_28060 [Nocardioides maradonensis]